MAQERLNTPVMPSWAQSPLGSCSCERNSRSSGEMAGEMKRERERERVGVQSFIAGGRVESRDVVSVSSTFL